jgi:hypothetical protein
MPPTYDFDPTVRAMKIEEFDPQPVHRYLFWSRHNGLCCGLFLDQSMVFVGGAGPGQGNPVSQVPESRTGSPRGAAAKPPKRRTRRAIIPRGRLRSTQKWDSRWNPYLGLILSAHGQEAEARIKEAAPSAYGAVPRLFGGFSPNGARPQRKRRRALPYPARIRRLTPRQGSGTPGTGRRKALAERTESRRP